MAEMSVDITNKHSRQHFFVRRQLQLTIASLCVVAMIGTLVVQYLSTMLTAYMGLSSPMLGFFLIIGYMVIIALISIVFTHRFVGPFQRLSREMRVFSFAEDRAEFSVRASDDLYVRSFITSVNEFVSRVQDATFDFKTLFLKTEKRLQNLSASIADKGPETGQLVKDLDSLGRDIRSTGAGLFTL